MDRSCDELFSPEEADTGQRKETVVRTLPPHPDLAQLKRQAKELLDSFRGGDSAAAVEVAAYFHGAEPGAFALHDAQLVLARAYGYDSWPKLKAFVDGVTLRRLVEAVKAGDLDEARLLLGRRPELARGAIDNVAAIHHAVGARNAAMVRLLMEHGASAREGVYPHRDATSALTMARERGYEEIVAIIEEAEGRRSIANEPGLFEAVAAGTAIPMLEANPALAAALHPNGWALLHLAARRLDEALAAWLLDHGADLEARGPMDRTALDVAAEYTSGEEPAFAPFARFLRERGARQTARAAAALGDLAFLRGQSANPIDHTGGLLRIAASHNRADVLTL
ncbi:MAG TPA: hypothetical protein DEH78_18960, partial [Solibacterales bacterium]|nr:hypothetical protein [Bryobacterales bacterium]